jgi:hypothetical protein
MLKPITISLLRLDRKIESIKQDILDLDDMIQDVFEDLSELKHNAHNDKTKND